MCPSITIDGKDVLTEPVLAVLAWTTNFLFYY